MKRPRILEAPSMRRRAEFLAAVKRNKTLHWRWVVPPSTKASFERYLQRIEQEDCLGYWVVTESDELAGVIDVTQIVRGLFRSAYIGYYAFSPHNGRGYMTRGLKAVLSDVFTVQKLHRLEANIQPGNAASRAVVQKLGFRLEGFSPRYLKIAGRWRDHERWAITIEDWR